MKNPIKLPKIKKWDCAALCAVMLLRILIFAICEIGYTLDSSEFIYMNGFQWISGVLDRYRLPLYPMLIEVCQRLAGVHSLKLLCALQLFVSLVSVVALYALFKKLSDKPYVSLPLFVTCGAAYVMSYWDKLILTESLSLSLTVILLWALVCYIKENKLRYIVIAIVTAGLGSFLRVTFAVYTGAIFVFLLLQLIFPGAKETKNVCRSNAWKGLIVTAVPIVLILCYALVFSQQHGSFTLSHSGLGQQLYIVIQEGYYQDGSDEEIKQDIRHMLDTKLPDEITDDEQAAVTDQKYTDTLQAYFQKIYKSNEPLSTYDPVYRIRCYIMQTYEPDRISAFVNEAKSANLLQYLMKMPDNSLAGFSTNYTVFKTGKVYDWLETIPRLFVNLPRICLLQAMCIGAVELAVYVYLLLKKKTSSWIHLGFGAMIVATGVLSLFGTNIEFARTAITAYPMIFAVFVIWVNAAMDLILRRAQTSQ